MSAHKKDPWKDDDTSEPDLHAQNDSWAAHFDRLLWCMGTLISIFILLSAALCFLGWPSENAMKLALKATGVAALPLLYRTLMT